MSLSCTSKGRRLEVTHLPAVHSEIPAYEFSSSPVLPVSASTVPYLVLPTPTRHNAITSSSHNAIIIKTGKEPDLLDVFFDGGHLFLEQSRLLSHRLDISHHSVECNLYY